MKRIIATLILGLMMISVYAHPGIGLVYDGIHTIYFTDLSHVWKLDTRTGESKIYVENVHTHELFLDNSGKLYGEHYWYIESQQVFKNYIWVMHPDGEFEKIRGDQNGENKDFGFVRDDSFTSYEIIQRDGKHAIVKIDSVGEKVWHELNLHQPTWKYITQSGELLFVDYPSLYSASTDKVEVLVKDISYSRFPFSLQSDHHSLYGMWTDQEQNIFIANYGGREVTKLSPNGDIQRVLKTDFLWSPVNGVFDQDNNLWLMECKIGGDIRVRKINSNEMKGKASFMLENGLIIGAILMVILVSVFSWRRKATA